MYLFLPFPLFPFPLPPQKLATYLPTHPTYLSIRPSIRPSTYTATNSASPQALARAQLAPQPQPISLTTTKHLQDQKQALTAPAYNTYTIFDCNETRASKIYQIKAKSKKTNPRTRVW